MKRPIANLILCALFFNVLNAAPYSTRSDLHAPKADIKMDEALPEASQIDINGPAGSGQFGLHVAVLPNGNIVVTDPYYDLTAPAPVTDVGAVYLYDASTLSLISQLTGSFTNDNVGIGGITVLANGNYVVNSRNWNGITGAYTWCSATTGRSGAVSAANSLVGTAVNDGLESAVTALANGHYVVRMPGWDGPAPNIGAVTWGNGSVGLTGPVSAATALIGSNSGDTVGSDGVVPLPNGNYVVRSNSWGRSMRLGAVTFANGSGPVSAVVSSTNSLVGGSPLDVVGSNGVTILTNGNYVVNTTGWDNPTGGADAGAVTFGSGTTGVSGAVSSANSLVGGSANDFVGWGSVIPLPNGNYVVNSLRWGSNELGAVTWGNGTTGVIGVVSAANSLVGSTTNDFVGGNGVIALANGNYVVSTGGWGPNNLGAVTWGNGTAGVTGAVSDLNSLTGLTAEDSVGERGATALTNGHYVVKSPQWDNGSASDAGAATWCNGTMPTVAKVTTANSLVGTQSNDRVAEIGVTPLTNGHYVVNTRNWKNGTIAGAGAATWRNGFGPSAGIVSAANSLVGSTEGDFIGRGSIANEDGIVALTNGNYVVNTPSWSNGLGAITWGSGTAGISGEVSTSNSLIGGRTISGAGHLLGNGGLHALANGHYVVRSPAWGTAGQGAITWGNGFVGITGSVSASNSIIGANSGDFALAGDAVTELSNGNFILTAPFWGIEGAVAYGAGNGPTVGSLTPENSVAATAPNEVLHFSTTLSRERLVVAKPRANTVAVLNPTYKAVQDGVWSGTGTWNYGPFLHPHDVVIPGGRNVTLDTNIPGGTLTVDNGASLALSGNFSSHAPITNNGIIDLSLGRLSMMSNVLSVGCTGVINGAGPNGYVIGATKKNFCSPASFNFPVGTPNGYSPVSANVTALGASTSNLTVSATQTTHPRLGLPNSLKRYWTITEGGDPTADIVFHYNDPLDIAGDESTYKLFRIDGSTPTLVPGFVLNTNANTMSVSGINTFSDWAIGNLPAAANVLVGGRVLRPDGRGLGGALVAMSDPSGQVRYTVTNPFGFYRFFNVLTGVTYGFSVSSKRYNYAPQNVTVNGELTDLDFVPTP